MLITARPRGAPRFAETLRSIARQFYGDGQLWYVIAQANGLTNDRDVKIGQTLSLPANVGTLHNDADTFKSYDASKITGDTQPGMYAPDEGCGTWGKIIVVIVVSIASYGTLTAEATQGGAVLLSTQAAIGAGAASAALGSVAGQLVGTGLGVQDKFSWKSMAASVVAAGISTVV